MRLRLVIPLFASICLHAALFGLIFLIYSAVPRFGASGGSQLVIDVQFEGNGIPGDGDRELPEAGAMAARPDLLRVYRESGLQLADLKTVTVREKPINRQAPKPRAQARQAENEARPNPDMARGSESALPGSLGTGGGIGGGTGSSGGGEDDGRWSAGFVRAALRDAPKPAYPEMARIAGFEGRVVLHAAIDAEGKVTDASVQKSSGRGDCDDAAREAVLRKWRFEPAKLNGSPVPCREKIVVVYNLKRF